jgi:hypothetical protein
LCKKSRKIHPKLKKAVKAIFSNHNSNNFYRSLEEARKVFYKILEDYGETLERALRVAIGQICKNNHKKYRAALEAAGLKYDPNEVMIPNLSNFSYQQRALAT